MQRGTRDGGGMTGVSWSGEGSGWESSPIRCKGSGASPTPTSESEECIQNPLCLLRLHEHTYGMCACLHRLMCVRV